jgi:hypothetical protein
MTASKSRGAADCVTTERNAPIRGKVVTDYSGRLYVCIDELDPVEYAEFARTVSLVSLSDGVPRKLFRSGILGVLKPELLSGDAKLQLSQVKTVTRSEAPPNATKYRAYCFLDDGRYSDGVTLSSVKDALEYVKMQARYQFRVLLCGEDECAVLEVRGGRVKFSASLNLTPESACGFGKRTSKVTERMPELASAERSEVCEDEDAMV